MTTATATDADPIPTVLYARVSVARKGMKNDANSQTKSVTQQMEWLRDWAIKAGRRVVAELSDDGISASRYSKGKARPEWQRAMELIASGEAAELAVWETSRSTRDRAVWAALMAALIDAGAMIAVGGKVSDPSDPDDAFALDLAAMLAVRESGMTSKRVSRDTAARLRDGQAHGPVQYGIRVEYDPETGRPVRRVEDAAAAAIVRDAARRVLSGETPHSIARELNGRGILAPQGGRWTGNGLLRTLALPALAGLAVHRGEILPGVAVAWPALITLAQHRELAAMLADKTRGTVRNGTHSKYLLTGIGTCGVCGGPLGTLTRSKPGSARVVLYRCRTKFCTGRRADELDEMATAAVVARLSHPDFLAALRAAAADDPATAAAEKEATELEIRLDKVRAAVAAGSLSVDALIDIEAAIGPQLRTARRKATPTHVPAAVLEMAGPDARQKWTAAPLATRRAVLRAVLAVAVLPSPKRGRFSAPTTDHVRITPR